MPSAGRNEHEERIGSGRRASECRRDAAETSPDMRPAPSQRPSDAPANDGVAADLDVPMLNDDRRAADARLRLGNRPIPWAGTPGGGARLRRRERQ